MAITVPRKNLVSINKDGNLTLRACEKMKPVARTSQNAPRDMAEWDK
ncbi:MAG: hypothetical protein HQL68_09915, partial [Magnetococcales bacterium]|nr:hypothetical protein [Magnetococcales bacterium]